LAHSSGDQVPSLRPFNDTPPEASDASPDRARSSVDLPAPFGPTTATTLPGESSSVTPSRIARAPALTEIAPGEAHPRTIVRARAQSQKKNGADRTGDDADGVQPRYECARYRVGAHDQSAQAAPSPATQSDGPTR
jgi:hypothetical protein